MSSGGGGTNTQSTVQTVKIPDYLQSASLDAVEMAKGIGAQPYQPYPGQTIADLTPQQQAAIAAGSANASNPAWGSIAGDALSRTAAVPGQVNPTYADSIARAASVPGQVAPLFDASTSLAGDVLSRTTPLYTGAALTAGGVPNLTAAGYNAANSFTGDIMNRADPLYMGAALQAGGIPGAVAPTYGAAGSMLAGSADAQRLVDPGAVMNPGDVPAWMSPYLDMALQPQIEAIQRQGNVTGKGINAQAAGAGAFGDARTGVQAGLNDRNTQLGISAAVGQGYQSAYDRAVQAAKDVAAQRAGLTGQRLSANQQLQSAGQAMGQLGTEIGSTGINAADLMQRIATAQAGTEGNVADLFQKIASSQGATNLSAGDLMSRIASAQGTTEQNVSDAFSRIAAARAGVDTTAATTAAQIAGQMGSTNLAAADQYGKQTATDYALQQQQAQDLMGYGKTQQDQTQASLSQAYQDFVNQREYPKEALNLLLASIQGVPYSTTRMTTTPYNSTAANIGLLSSILGVGGKLTSSANA